MNWEEYFYYDPESPTGLRWLKAIYAGKTGKSLIIKKDQPAGCFISNKDCTPKCVDVRLKGKLYKVHRIIYELEFGEIESGFVIDHLDQNPWNNFKGDLEAKPKAMNHRNTKKVRTNTSGATGVGWHTMNKKKQTYAVARIQVDNVLKEKRFSVAEYGLMPAFKLACEWRHHMIEDANKAGAGFTELHGA